MRRKEMDCDDVLVRVCNLLHSYPERWWIAGGWALDLHRGAECRVHGDVDVAVLRRDQSSLRRFLSGWSIYKMVNGSREPWTEHEHLVLPIHEIHAERNGTHLECLLNETSEERWIFRRNHEVSLPLFELSRTSSTGIPYLCPQVVLLYKAKNPRPIDHEDFERALPTLQRSDVVWLAEALELCHPRHEWLAELRAR